MIFVLSGTMILASCNSAPSAPETKEYYLTFHQTEPGDIQDVVVTVIKGKTTNPEVWEQEPEINPKVGYDTQGWEEYDVTTLTEDCIVEPVYVAHQYTATFIDRETGEQLGTDTFTIEDESLDYPELPSDPGYNYSWSEVEISANDLTVYCDRVGKTFIVSYADSLETTSVTYGSPYELLEVSGIYDWYYGDTLVPQSGEKWNIASDVTLEKKLCVDPKLVDFENGQNKIFKIKSGFTSIEVVDNEGLGGSKALKVSCSATNLNDAFLQAEKDYLDEVFKDPEVKSLSFYAKGSAVTNNFRHIKVGTQYVEGNTRLIECYENNDSKYGMTNEYKKFYLTRNVYLQMFQSDNLNNTDYIIKYGKSGAAFDMYLDNFEMCYTDYFEHKQNGLEFGGLDTSYNEASFKVYGVGNTEADFYINNRKYPNDSGSYLAYEAGFDYSIHSEGQRSLKITKTSQEIDFYLGGHFAYANLPDEGIYFDYYADVKFNAAFVKDDLSGFRDGFLHDGFAGGGSSKPMQISTNIGSAGSGVVVEANKWYTFHVLKSQIHTNGRFFVIGSHASATTGTFYIDNIRLANSEPMESFEDAHSFFGGKYTSESDQNLVGGASSYPVDATVGAIPPIQNKQDYLFMAEWSTVNSAEISEEKASIGHKSLKLGINSAAAFRLRDSYVTQLFKYANAKIAFDVYTEDVDDDHLKLITLGGNTTTITSGQWSTIELTKADFLDGTSYRNEGRFTTRAFGEGTVYIDNIRLLNASY